MVRAKSVWFSASKPWSTPTAGCKYSRMRRLSLCPRSWQLDDVIESRGSSANRMQQRHDSLQPVPCSEDSAIEPLSVLVEAFGQRDLLMVSQQGNPANLDQVMLK